MIPDDRLLYAISAKGEMSWSVFKRTFELLCGDHLTKDTLEDMTFARYETARTLDALGHVEVDFGEDARLYVAPPALAVLPNAGLPVAVLSGARSTDTVDRVSAYLNENRGKFELDIRNQYDDSKRFPSRVAITSESTEDLARLAQDLNLAFHPSPAAWAILNFAGSLDDYASGCEWLPTDRLNWDEHQFDVERLCFSAAPYPGRLQLIRYTHPSRQYPIYFLWRGSEAARVDPDWARFAVLKETQRYVLHYDRSSYTLLVPATVPLPKLLARAVCLCSGLIPRAVSGSVVVDSPVNNQRFRAYLNVPHEFAQMVAGKLDQELITNFTLMGLDNG